MRHCKCCGVLIFDWFNDGICECCLDDMEESDERKEL